MSLWTCAHSIRERHPTWPARRPPLPPSRRALHGPVNGPGVDRGWHSDRVGAVGSSPNARGRMDVGEDRRPERPGRDLQTPTWEFDDLRVGLLDAVRIEGGRLGTALRAPRPVAEQRDGGGWSSSVKRTGIVAGAGSSAARTPSGNTEQNARYEISTFGGVPRRWTSQVVSDRDDHLDARWTGNEHAGLSSYEPWWS